MSQNMMDDDQTSGQEQNQDQEQEYIHPTELLSAETDYPDVISRRVENLDIDPLPEPAARRFIKQIRMLYELGSLSPDRSITQGLRDIGFSYKQVSAARGVKVTTVKATVGQISKEIQSAEALMVMYEYGMAKNILSFAEIDHGPASSDYDHIWICENTAVAIGEADGPRYAVVTHSYTDDPFGETSLSMGSCEYYEDEESVIAALYGEQSFQYLETAREWLDLLFDAGFDPAAEPEERLAENL